MKNKTVKKCPCGRIITDPKNKTGLCPRCQKKANGAAAGVGVAGIALGIKRFGPKIVEGIKIVIRR